MDADDLSRAAVPQPSDDDRRGMREAMLLVVTRGVSGFGTAMTLFALNIWVLKATGSYTAFVLVNLLGTLPNLLVLPFAGALQDHGDKKRLLFACEAATLFVACAVLAMWRSGQLDTATVAAAVGILCTVAAIRWTLMGVVVTLLTGRRGLDRVNGIQQALVGASDVIAPVVGAALLQVQGLASVVSIDIATCVVALFSLLVMTSTRLAISSPSRLPGSSRQAYWQNIASGWRWIAERPLLRGVLLFVTGYNIIGGIFTVTFVPYLLSFSDATHAGRALACEGVGATLSGLVLAPRLARLRPELRVLSCALLFGLLLLVWGIAHTATAALMVGGCAGVLTSMLAASLQTLWQTQVPADIQGRVFAIRRTVSYSLIPLGTLTSIPVASALMHTALSQAGFWRSVWGTGRSGSIGLMLSACGALLATACTVVLLRGGLRQTASPAPARQQCTAS